MEIKRQTVKKDGKKISVAYPVTGIRRADGMISRIVGEYVKRRQRDGSVYSRLSCAVKNADPPSVLFESEIRFENGRVYAPFAVTFDSQGMLSPLKISRVEKKRLVSALRSAGGTVRPGDLQYSYYDDGGVLRFFAPDVRRRRTVTADRD